MRKEIYKIKNPKHIVFGDPLYFEDFKGAELKRLTVDYKTPKSFDAARLVLLEKPNEKYPEYTDRTMTLYLALRQAIDVYVDEKIYASQKIDGKSIGVDTARYYLSIDGRDDIIRTGADGWWGSFEEYYRENGKGRISDAVGLTVAIPDEQDFNWMKQMAGYFFGICSRLPPKGKRKWMGQAAEGPKHSPCWLRRLSALLWLKGCCSW